MCVYMCVCMCVCVYIYIYIYILLPEIHLPQKTAVVVAHVAVLFPLPLFHLPFSQFRKRIVPTHCPKV